MNSILAADLDYNRGFLCLILIVVAVLLKRALRKPERRYMVVSVWRQTPQAGQSCLKLVAAAVIILILLVLASGK